MDKIELTWQAETTDGKVLTESKNSYADVENKLGKLSFFYLFYGKTKVFEVDFKNGTLTDRGKLLHTFSKKIDQSTFKFRRRHIVRYSVAKKKRQEDYISYVIYANGVELELQPPYILSKKKVVDNVYEPRVVKDKSGEIKDANLLADSK